MTAKSYVYRNAVAILLVFYALSTDQENGCQAMHEKKIQKMVVLHIAWTAFLYSFHTEEQLKTPNCQVRNNVWYVYICLTTRFVGSILSVYYIRHNYMFICGLFFGVGRGVVYLHNPPPYPQKTTHICLYNYLISVHVQPEDGLHQGLKHVAVHNVVNT